MKSFKTPIDQKCFKHSIVKAKALVLQMEKAHKIRNAFRSWLMHKRHIKWWLKYSQVRMGPLGTREGFGSLQLWPWNEQH